MWTIVDSVTGRVLFAKFDNQVLDGQTAIEQICNIEPQDGMEIYFNFETEEFELR